MITILNKLKISIIFVLLITTFSSCLKQDLPEYPLWEENSITNVNIEYRYEGSQEYLDDPLVSYQQFMVEETINEDLGSISLNITVPEVNGDFTEEVRNGVHVNKLWMNLDISTAATIVPTNGTPDLGEPMDMSTPKTFDVIAANGDKKSWIIEVNSFIK